MSTICKTAADVLNADSECLCTEDLLHDIERYNMEPEADMVRVSLDAVSLYPSLEKEETSRICAQMVLESKMWFEAINWEELGLYIILTGAECNVS